MKQLLQNARSGRLEFADVPAPAPGRGQILVRTAYSVMSPGTDKLQMDFARKSMLAKAWSRPDLVDQVVGKLKQEGPLATYRTVMTRLDVPQPFGYSCAGVVEALGAGVDGFQVGDHVACAGAGYANHAELVVVPENLAAPVPPEVPLEHATFATLGAIALQGVRVADPTLGEIAAVVGLGLIGQLTVQLLRANGCRVLGTDLDEKRTKQTLDQGATWAETPNNLTSNWKDAVTGGHGVDLAVVTASAASSAPLKLAADLCRQKGRIAFVGAMPIELDRRSMYDKELDLRMSMSYGPGRYDRSYEEVGLDYPISYVRWTENRNLRAFLDLIASGGIHPERLDTSICPIEGAVEAYEDLNAGRTSSLAVVFQYGESVSMERTFSLKEAPGSERRGDVGVGFIGAGNYAKAVLLPVLDRTKAIDRLSLVTATGPSAKSTAEKFGFSGCGTDPKAVLKDPNVDLVFVATRHDSHSQLAIDCLRENKAVWLEKPAALDPEQLESLAGCVRETNGFLAIGYNRRFSSHARKIKDLFSKRHGPISIRYRVAPGPAPRGTWALDAREGGGRIVGESCHFMDLCTYLVGAPPSAVYARALAHDPDVDDSTFILLSFPDGSTAAIEYLANTDTRLPKECFEVHGGGMAAECTNFRFTTLTGHRDYRTFNQDKGQATAVADVVSAVKAGKQSPFSLEEILGVSRATFAVAESIAQGAAVPVDAS